MKVSSKNKRIDNCFRRMIRELMEEDASKTYFGASMAAGRSKGWMSLFMNHHIKEINLADFTLICDYFEIEPSWFMERWQDGDYDNNNLH